MNREILFRGKALYGRKEWVYGVPVPVKIDSYMTDRIEMVESHGYDELDNFNLLSIDDEVNPDTVGQYTGLRDKNGEKIFEDDIVCWPKEDGYGHVYWAKDEARFVIEFEGCIVDFDNLWGHEIEVYGNIYDNPELLER